MTRDEFDASYDDAYAQLKARGVARQRTKDALLLAAGLGQSMTGPREYMGYVDTVVTFDRERGYVVRDATEEDVSATADQA